MNNEEQSGRVCGFLNILKPPGMSSAHVVGFVRRRLHGEKVGHAGTLDPEAAGVLPLMIGNAARLLNDLPEERKSYIAEIAFGTATDTQDAQGNVVDSSEEIPSEEDIRNLLPTLLGEMMQEPPMYSALKQNGKRLYELAREGKTVERKKRAMVLYSVEFLRMTHGNGALIAITCSKGFYVRTLCHDIGVKLGCPAHMRFLLRTASGMFHLDTARTLEEISEAAEKDALQSLLIPIDDALQHLPRADVPKRFLKQFQNGVPLPLHAFFQANEPPQAGRVQMRVQGKVMAVAEVRGDWLRPSTWLG